MVGLVTTVNRSFERVAMQAVRDVLLDLQAVCTAPLVELGYRDAQQLEEELLRFFSD